MVAGLDKVRAQLNAVPELVRRELIREMERSANEMVKDMRALVPVRSGVLRASIGWTWGDVPAGALKIGQVRGRSYGRLAITIYAGNRAAYYARFVEFGTRPHAVGRNASLDRGLRQDGIGLHPGASPRPFFYPVYRANRRRVRARLSRAVTRAVKQANQKR